MAKKKKPHKKKSQYKTRKQSSPSVSTSTGVVGLDQPTTSSQVVESAPGDSTTSKLRTTAKKDDSDVVIARRARYEVGHALLIAGIIMLGLIALWLVMSYTSLGAQVYKLVKLS